MNGMGKMFIIIDDKVEQDFKAKARRVYPDKKGVLSQAANEALKSWVISGKK